MFAGSFSLFDSSNLLLLDGSVKDGSMSFYQNF
jgi:hypothetical protein